MNTGLAYLTMAMAMTGTDPFEAMDRFLPEPKTYTRKVCRVCHKVYGGDTYCSIECRRKAESMLKILGKEFDIKIVRFELPDMESEHKNTAPYYKLVLMDGRILIFRDQVATTFRKFAYCPYPLIDNDQLYMLDQRKLNKRFTQLLLEMSVNHLGVHPNLMHNHHIIPEEYEGKLIVCTEL